MYFEKDTSKSRGSSVNIATRIRAGRHGFDCRQVQGFFLLSTTPKRALGPTQPPIRWVTGAPLAGVKWQEHEADNPLPLMSRLIMRVATPPLLQYIFMVSYLVKHRDNLTFCRHFKTKRTSVT
jgi:hypothetical protein